MRRGRVGLGLLLVCGALVAAGAARTEALLPQSIRPAPAALTGAFGALHVDLHVSGTIVVLGLMLGAYVLVIGATEQLSERAVVSAVLAVQLLLVLAAPLVSTDVFSYQAYSRMAAVYGIDPYTHGPVAIRLDPVFAFVGAKWSDTPTVYGPLFSAGGELLARLGVAASVVAYKVIALAAGLGLVAVVRQCARMRGVDPVRAVVIVGLNPLLVVDAVGGGHNDLLMTCVLTFGVWALLAGRQRSGGALIVLAAAIKLTALIALPFALAAPVSGRPTLRPRLLGMTAGLLVFLAVGLAWFGSGPAHLLATLRDVQTSGGWESIPGTITSRLHLPTAGRIVGDVLVAGFLAVVAALLVAVRRGHLDWIDATGWATVALLVSASALSPWYITWLLPFAALARDRRLVTAALVLTGLLQAAQLLGMIPHG